MQKVFNLIPPEYRNQDNQDIEKPKERKEDERNKEHGEHLCLVFPGVGFDTGLD